MSKRAKICRRECPITMVHSTRLCRFAFGRASPKKTKPESFPILHNLPPWRQLDQVGLIDSVLRAIGDQPTLMRWIARDVRDDYGQVTDRSIYRYVRKLVADEVIVKVDIGLNFATYVKPKSRMLGDLEALRDYMLGLVEITACAKDSVA